MVNEYADNNLLEIGIESDQVVADNFEAVQDYDDLIVGAGHGTNGLTD